MIDDEIDDEIDNEIDDEIDDETVEKLGWKGRSGTTYIRQ